MNVQEQFRSLQFVSYWEIAVRHLDSFRSLLAYFRSGCQLFVVGYPRSTRVLAEARRRRDMEQGGVHVQPGRVPSRGGRHQPRGGGCVAQEGARPSPAHCGQVNTPRGSSSFACHGCTRADIQSRSSSLVGLSNSQQVRSERRSCLYLRSHIYSARSRTLHVPYWSGRCCLSREPKPHGSRPLRRKNRDTGTTLLWPDFCRGCAPCMSPTPSVSLLVVVL
jgi:hypothetical protein